MKKSSTKNYIIFNILLGNLKIYLTALCLITFSACKKTHPDISQTTDSPNQGKVTKTATGDEFTIVVLPDTQYYTRNGYKGGRTQMLNAQITWIRTHAASEKIAYVVHLGDIVDKADSTYMWVNAKNSLYQLETSLTGYPDGIPYGLSIGNHDQTPGENPIGTTSGYDQYFGVSHFQNKSYYGGHYNSDNDNHYDLFSADGINFIAIYLEFNRNPDPNGGPLLWAYNLLSTYASRKAIIVTHFLLNTDATVGDNFGAQSGFGTQGGITYEKLKNMPNVFMMLGGHSVPPNGQIGPAEGFRQDTYNGKTIKSYLSNYQNDVSGGSGYMRLMKFSADKDLVSIKTYSPYLDSLQQIPNYTDLDSQFDEPWFHEPTACRTVDFDNNGKSQLTVYKDGLWMIDGLGNRTYGSAGSIDVTGDYDGNGKADLAYWQSTSPYTWAITSMTNINYGTAGDIPVPADYDGDGRTDVAVYRPSDGRFYVSGQGNYDMTSVTTGIIPVPADYDGDGKVDFAIFNTTSTNWLIRKTTTGTVSNISYGVTNDIPVPGDYNGDGVADIAIYRPSDGTWHVSGQTTVIYGGQAGDIPCPGDYFGDGKTHVAYYRGTTLYIKDGSSVTLGASGYRPVNLPYHIRKFFFP